MLDIIKGPWPWYVSGPLIGLIVPILLLIDARQFGISSSFRHLLGACQIKGVPYFNYSWKSNTWNLFFVTGIVIGAYIAFNLIGVPNIDLNPEIITILSELGVTDFDGLLPDDYFTFIPTNNIGWIFTLGGGFLIGFGTRWADGCTAGHTIMGLALLNKTSLIATVCFFVGGLISARFIMPFIINLLSV